MSNVSTGSISQIEPALGNTDWKRIARTRDEDIVTDDDSPATKASDWDGALLKLSGKQVGAVRTRGKNKRPTKEQVAIRLDAEVLLAFRASGRGWQTRLNAALKDWLRAHPVGA